MGWFRRSPKPYLEIRKVILKDGTTVTSYLYPFQQFLVYLSLVVGVVLLGLEILL
jgi:hypothetical protein